MQNRSPIGYVIQVESNKVTLNLLDQHRGQMASHSMGVSAVTEIGGLLAIDGGHRLLVLRITELNFAEPKEVHIYRYRRAKGSDHPLRNLQGIVVGWIEGSDEERRFYSDNLVTPSLGAQAFPLQQEEVGVIVGGQDKDAHIKLGTEFRTGISVNTGLNSLLAQHVAVIGGSGQGKSCFTAAVLQQLSKLPNSRIVIFDINGEYDRAFKKSEWHIEHKDNSCRLPGAQYKHTVIGESEKNVQGLKIPYYALGRHGLHRLLLPSEKTQRPALSFAIDHLRNVEWHEDESGVSLVEGNPVLFDDCRQQGADVAMDAIEQLRSGSAKVARNWPNMECLAALVAESHSLAPKFGASERNAFLYSNVSPLVTRIRRYIDDEMFRAIVDVSGGSPTTNSGNLNWQAESDSLVSEIFGTSDSKWRVHVVNLRQIPQDLMPMVLGSLLELYAYVLFRRGQGNNPATLLVLEEAHHYLRPIGNATETNENYLAYERLAKEGRKFGLSLWLSTQRPSEVSPTVLSQCNSWITFRLNTESDLRALASACDWADQRDVKRVAGLARQNAIVVGGCVAMPTTIIAAQADPETQSMDGPFDSWANGQLSDNCQS